MMHPRVERESSQQTIGRVDEARGDLASVDVAAPLEELVDSARSVPTSRGREAVGALHAALSTLMPTEANGSTLLRLLDDGALASLKSADGSSTRALAVETLLRLGFPWAMQLRPEELAWYRSHQFAQKRRNVLIGVLIFVSSVAGGLYVLNLL